ncbi:MAG: sugar ABC transporter substrate-binding protein [Planctomycetes bacterium]|nr:sugar ABC transporter substrate-binding protein [Planctomycetota bacterium]
MKRSLLLIAAALMISLHAAAGQYAIAWYAPMVHPYFGAVRKGVERFEKEHGIEVLKQLGQEWTQDNQNANVEALAARGFRGFSIYPADPNAANGLYEELVDNDITVINFGCPTAMPTPAAFTVATDVAQAARECTVRLIELMGGEGKIINVLEVLADANTMARKLAIEDVVAQYPGVTIIQEIGDINTVEDAIEKIQNAISGKINEVDGIIATGFATTVASAALLKDINTDGEIKIHFVGHDDDPSVLDAIRNGYIDTTMAFNTDGHGYLPCLILKHIQDGAKLRPNQHFIPGGQVFVTKDNIDTYSQDLSKETERIQS